MPCFHPQGIAPVAIRAFDRGALCTHSHIERLGLVLIALPERTQPLFMYSVLQQQSLLCHEFHLLLSIGARFCKKSPSGTGFAGAVEYVGIALVIEIKHERGGYTQYLAIFQERTAPHLGSERRSLCTGLFC